MPSGIVKWFNPEKGYGFIVPDIAGRDVFVHVSSIKTINPIQEGDAVSYDVGDNKGKSCAINVQLIH